MDALVGQRLRELRMLAGLSQSDLAATIGLTFQQLQKYERGVNRISASKLFLLARHLGVPVSALFADLEGQRGNGGESTPEADTPSETTPSGESGEPQLRSREALVLARHFMRIRDSSARAALKSFVEACAGMTAAQPQPSPRQGGEEDDGAESQGSENGGLRRTRRPRGVIWHPTDIERH